MAVLEEEVHKTLDFLRTRSRNFKLAFAGKKLDKYSPDTQAVLIDLARFCRANNSCFDADPRKHAVAEGRREVWLRIANHLRLSPTELYAIYSGRNFQLVESEDNG